MKRRAFTLIEFLVALSIVAILGAVLIQNHQTKGAPVNPVAPGPSITVQTYDVQQLFSIDGMKVYRFKDGGHYIYFVDGRNSKTAWSESTQIGKTTIEKPVEVHTVR